MKVEFLSLEIRDFKCFKKYHLDIMQHGPGFHFVRGVNKAEPSLGSNGAGKSSLWDAMCWCLYGRTPDGLKNPDILPWGPVKPKPCVSVLVAVNGDLCTITRTTNPNRLLINDSEVGPDGPAELIGLSYDLFTNTVLLGQGQPLFFDLGPKSKMQLFTDVLDLDRWDTRSANAAAKARKLENKMAVIQGEMEGIKSNWDQVKELLASAIERSREWDEERQSRVKVYRKEKKELEAKHKNAKTKWDKASLEYDGAMLELKALRKSRREMEDELQKARRERDRVLLEVERLESEADDLEGQLVVLDQTDTCPTCGQEIESEDLDDHRKEIKKKLKDLRKRIKAGPDRAVIDRFVELEVQHSTNKAYEPDFEGKAEKAREQMDYWYPIFNTADVKLTELNAKIEEWDSEDNPYQDQVGKLKRRRTKLKAQQEEYQEQYDKLSRILERTKFWVKGFRDIRLYIIEEVLQELKLTTQATLEEVGLVGWQVDYAVEKETKSGTIQRGLNITILSPSNTKPVRWESWSGGEGQRLRLVGALALSEVLLNYAGVETQLEILDEPTRGLSSEGVRDLCDFLSDRAKQLDRSTFYVDHMSMESSRFDSVITITKERD